MLKLKPNVLKRPLVDTIENSQKIDEENVGGKKKNEEGDTPSTADDCLTPSRLKAQKSSEEVQDDSSPEPDPSSSSGPDPSPESVDVMVTLGVRHCPWPKLRWADREILWQYFCRKDRESKDQRNYSVFDRHPNLHAGMRIVLFEWVMEVCDAFGFHRETYFLTLHYFDRYLSETRDQQKNDLQLIGISCLLIACKVEEIHAPQVNELIELTDNTVTKKEIYRTEWAVVKALNWGCYVMTPNSWLSVILQFLFGRKHNELEFAPCQFPERIFTEVSQLLDMAVLHPYSLNFSYCILATSCTYIVFSKTLALDISGYSFTDIETCVYWLEPLWFVLREENSPFPPQLKLCSETVGFSHTLQHRERFFGILNSVGSRIPFGGTLVSI